MSAEASPAAEPAPRHRYFTVPPATVRLPVDDLTALLPEGAWIGTAADKRRELALPTAEILEKNFPRIRFSRLRDLLPGCIAPVDGAPEWIVLPTDRIALAYQPETRREEILESAKPADGAADAPAESVMDKDAPVPAWKKVPRPEPAPVPTAPEPAPVPFADKRLAPEAEARLRQAFMTEEDLTVARLVALGGALPSLQGIVLTNGKETIRSSEHLAAVDAATLDDAASEVLAKMGATSGLHFQPTVTLYAESGPISFLRHGDLRLVVIHRERAFLPGVREKLDAILEAIGAVL